MHNYLDIITIAGQTLIYTIIHYLID